MIISLDEHHNADTNKLIILNARHPEFPPIKVFKKKSDFAWHLLRYFDHDLKWRIFKWTLPYLHKIKSID